MKRAIWFCSCAFVAKNVDPVTIENILKHFEISMEEIEPLINSICSDDWKSYQTASIN
tara:strand:+ start:345 stop:518 length:174 start_codon:yes stop_codon:yes gene_type:complete